MSSNRGAHPEDARLFEASRVSTLRAAVRDLSWLRTRGYGDRGALKLVGDRYRLERRQRDAVARSACSDSERRHRLDARIAREDVEGEWIEIDGFNVLITVEAALGGAYLFVGRDTAYRDVNPVRGTYRVVHQTAPAIERLANTMDALGVDGATWYLDHSVSNVGRVRARLLDGAPASSVQWKIEIGHNVDAALLKSGNPVATSDSEILDESDRWFHLEAALHDRLTQDTNLVDLRPDGERSVPALRA